MTTTKATSPREELARIIDPSAFDNGDYSTAERALAKADEWLSRPPVKAASPEGEADNLGENPYERCLRVAVEPFLEWLDAREASAGGVHDVREGLIGVEDVLPDTMVLAGAPLRREPTDALTFGHLRRLREAYEGRPVDEAIPTPPTTERAEVVAGEDRAHLLNKVDAAQDAADAAEATIEQMVRSLTLPDEPDDYNPTPEQRAEDFAKTYLRTPPKPEAPAIGEGWKLVPVEPTPEMFGAGGVQAFKDDMARTRVRDAVGNQYRAMLAAAPTPDSQGEES